MFHLCICLSVFVHVHMYDCMFIPNGGDGEGGLRGGRGGREQRQSGIIVTDRAAP